MVELTHNERCLIYNLLVGLRCGPKQPRSKPVDYAVWGTLQQQVYYNRKFTTVAVDQLKQAIVEEWNKLSQRFIDRSIDEWRCRLTDAVHQQGGHIEHI